MKTVIAFAVFCLLCEACDETCFLEEIKGVKAASVQYCPFGWVRYGDEKCFKLYPDIAKTHDEAENFCHQQGATSASIRSDDERQALMSYIAREGMISDKTAQIWLGGNKVRTLWFWSDMSPFDYDLHWIHAYGNCVYIYIRDDSDQHFGKLGTWRCSDQMYVMCQKFQRDSKHYLLS